MIHTGKHFRKTLGVFVLSLMLSGGASYLAACSEPAAKEISELQRKTWNNPDDAALWLRLGNAYARAENYRKAEESYRKALSVDSSFAAALPALGAACFNQRNYPEALVHFRKYRELAPDDSLRNYDVGNVLLQMQEYDKAITAYQKAIANSLFFEEAYYNLAICCLRSGNRTRAEEIYRLLVKKNNYLAVSLKEHLDRADNTLR